MKSAVVNVTKLAKWIGVDPYRQALLIDEARTSHSTLAKILSGNYKPSGRLANRINTIMARFPDGDPARAKQEAVGA